MDLTKTSKTLGAIGIALTLMATAASAQLTVLETHTCTFPVTLTSWQSSCQVDLYDGSGVLEEVMVTLDGGAESELTLENQSGSNATVLDGFVGANIAAAWTISGQNLSLNALPTGTFAPPSLTIPGNSTTTLADVSGTDTDMLTNNGVANPAVTIYNGTGTFTVDVNADGVLSNLISGGNVALDQDTEAFATFTVQYKGTPEPNLSPSLLSAFALAGIAGFRRRRNG